MICSSPCWTVLLLIGLEREIFLVSLTHFSYSFRDRLHDTRSTYTIRLELCTFPCHEYPGKVYR